MYANDAPMPPVDAAGRERDGEPPPADEPDAADGHDEDEPDGEDEAGYGYGV
jgi:hypothetical protein